MESKKNDATKVMSDTLTQFKNHITKEFGDIFEEIEFKPVLPVNDLDELDRTFKHLPKREEKYTEILNNFVETYSKKNESKLRQREIFFDKIINLLSYLVIGSIVAIILSLILNTHTIEVLVFSLTSILSSIICLPTIVAKYLFDPQEEARMNDLIKGMFDYDTENRKDYIGQLNRRNK